MKERTYQITVDGIPITVTKKRMKNLYLRVKQEDGSVLISAPHQCSDARIRRFAMERIEWIRDYREKYLEMSRRRQARHHDPSDEDTLGLVQCKHASY